MQHPNFIFLWMLFVLLASLLLLFGAAMLPLPEASLQDGLHFGKAAFLL